MNQFEQFHAALDLTKVSDNVYSFTPDPRYFVGNTPHGGYILALMNKAMSIVLTHPSAINSNVYYLCLLYTSPSPRDRTRSRMPSSA